MKRMKAGQIESKRIVLAVLASVLAVQLSPIWMFKYFASQDGPAHLENAANSWSAIVLLILPYRLRGTSPASKAMIARWTRSRASSLANRRAT